MKAIATVVTVFVNGQRMCRNRPKCKVGNEMVSLLIDYSPYCRGLR